MKEAKTVARPNKGLLDLLYLLTIHTVTQSYKMASALCCVKSGSNLFCRCVKVSQSNINIFFLIMKLQHFVTPTFTRQIDVFASLLQYSSKIFSHKKVNGNTMIMILLKRFL